MADVITRLKLESSEYDSRIKRATQGLLQMEQECRKVGGTLAVLEKDQLDFVRGLGQMETVSRSARGKVSELTSAFTELSVQYKHLSDEEKKGDYGKALSASLDQLKVRIKDAKTDLIDVEKELKGMGDAEKIAADGGVDFSSVLNQLGGQLGINTNMLNMVTTGTIATTAAVTAGVAAVAAATKAWADYNDEINRQNTMTTVVTGLKGDASEELTMGARALARTYDVDFRQAIEAANTLIQQFGVSGEQALSLLQDGMQGMIAGDGGKLLSMIQQYAPSFRDAGISASQLVAVIQNSEGGLFTDQNMQAIVMGIRNIRLMTKQTSDALAQLGIDGQEMSRKLEDGSMTIFEALRQVSGAIDNVGSGSKAAGEVMQAVFGRQGTMAGTKLGEAIATLNTNLEETKTQTGELGESFVRLNDANVRLENTMKEVFGMTGWEDMNNLIKTDLANTLSDVIGFLGDIKTSITDIGTADGFKALCDVLDSLVIPKLTGVTTMMKNIKAFMDGLNGNSGGGFSEGNGQIGGGIAGLVSSGKPKGFTITTDNNGKVIGATRDGQDVLAEYLATIAKNAPQPTTTTPKVRAGRKTAPSWAPITMQDLGMVSLGRSVKDVNADLARAQKDYTMAGDEFGRAAAKAMMEKYQNELKMIEMEGQSPFKEASEYDFSKDIEKAEKERKRVVDSEDDEKKKNDKKEVSLGKEIGNMAGGIQQMVGGLEQLGVDIPAGLQSVVGGIQAVSSILSGIMTVVMAIEAIAGADALIPFARGGVVKAAGGTVIPGNYLSGDMLRMPIVGGGMAALNSGEVILNKAEQGNLVSQMSGAGGALNLEAVVYGEDLKFVLNNSSRRRGRGEYVTSKNVRI